MPRCINKTKKGFSLIEVLITVTILSVGITSISFLMANDIRSSELARDQVIASSLAQEGVELMRNLKDNKGLNVSPFDKCSLNPCPTYLGTIDAKGIKVNDLGNDPASWNSASANLSLTGGYYVHNGGNATKFYRAIATQVTGDSTLNPSTRIITVVSEVWWGGSSTMPTTCTLGNKCVLVTSIMSDMQ